MIMSRYNIKRINKKKNKNKYKKMLKMLWCIVQDDRSKKKLSIAEYKWYKSQLSFFFKKKIISKSKCFKLNRFIDLTYRSILHA